MMGAALYDAPVIAEPVLDQVTGLPTLSHLVERIQDLQARARVERGPRRTVLSENVLLVISVAREKDRHAAIFTAARTASLLRALFSGEETVTLLRHGLFAVLTKDRPDLSTDRAFLVSMLAEFDVHGRVWTERVPADGPATANLLSSLLLAGDWSADN
jgi:hypothetical protein